MLVPRVRRYLDHELICATRTGGVAAARTVETLAALEGIWPTTRHGQFCHGDANAADSAWSHVTVAIMQPIDLSTWPTGKRIFETRWRCRVCEAHPLRSGHAGGDAPKA